MRVTISMKHQGYLNPKARVTRGLPPPNGRGGMSEAMRTIVWVVGVATGVAVPNALARTASEDNGKQASHVVLKLDANRDWIVIRQEAQLFEKPR